MAQKKQKVQQQKQKRTDPQALPVVDNEPHFVVQEEETQKETSESDGFDEADVDDIPAENYKEESKN